VVKILKFFDAGTGSRIWDGKNSDPGGKEFGSGMEKFGSGIGDKHPGSATLTVGVIVLNDKILK
jgi:hypothetical protein